MIGVAISTHRRPHILARALQGWAQHMPDVLTVIHDVDGDGVAATKNRSIAALMSIEPKIEHLFLADDDVWPTRPDWWQPYVDDPEPHLMHCWGKHRLVSDDGHYTTWTHPRGVLLYAHRSVIDTVGGMRTEFGRWGGEHAEWSTRIHNAGLTRHRYADLTACRDGAWHAEDYLRSTPSTVGQAEREASRANRQHLYRVHADSTDYVDYQ